MFDQMYALDPEYAAIEEGFSRIIGLTQPAHAQILEWASNPRSLFHGMKRTDPCERGEIGAPCPLCGFTTYAWYDFAGKDGADLAHLIAEDKSSWRAKRGACRQCAELYRAHAVISRT
ncbi:hypothetical protein HYR69_06160 [Candidatus Sumerlaeota bacterium]|nr:hypothetical protein [Candidatus Sumerlaeota bacterium]MBI3736576.1 hypothetical protein [Candidatus Sumerlaeota bacterium]